MGDRILRILVMELNAKARFTGPHPPFPLSSGDGEGEAVLAHELLRWLAGK